MPVGLTELGREQARALGGAVGPVDVAVHTSFERTRTTAELAWPDAPRVEVPELDEASFGRFEGTRFADGYHAWVRESGPHEGCPGGGESRAAAVARYARGYRRLLERPEETVAAVLHAAQIQYVLLALAGRQPTPVLDHVPVATPFDVDAAEFERAVVLIERWVADPRWV